MQLISLSAEDAEYKSIPNVAFIEFNLVTLEKGSILILEGYSSSISGNKREERCD